MTLQELIDQCQNVLADPLAGTWSEAKVSEWIVQAIREYSRYFPRRLSVEISATPGAGGHYNTVYALPVDFIRVVAVEFPKDEVPPVWLAHRSEEDADFGAGYYDIRRSGDSQSASYVVLGEEPGAGEALRVYYLGLHDTTLAVGDPITVPDEDIEIIVQFVKMRAFEERLGGEEQGADPTSNLVSYLGANAERVRSEFWALVEGRKRAGGGMVRWGSSSD